jgi:hypothetical protein
VTGCDPVGTYFASDVYEPRELELCVARDAGDWCAPCKIVLDKRANDPPLKLIFEVKHIKREAQIVSDRSRVVDVIQRAAS